MFTCLLFACGGVLPLGDCFQFAVWTIWYVYLCMGLIVNYFSLLEFESDAISTLSI